MSHVATYERRTQPYFSRPARSEAKAQVRQIGTAIAIDVGVLCRRRDDIAEERKAGMARGIDKTKAVLGALAAWRAEVAARIRRDAGRHRADSRA
jgi:hypothetical protein